MSLIRSSMGAGLMRVPLRRLSSTISLRRPRVGEVVDDE